MTREEAADSNGSGTVMPFELEINSLVSWSDSEPLDIVATLKANGVEIEEEK